MPVRSKEDKQRIREAIKKNKYDLRKIIDLLPCWTCEWRYNFFCPHCKWNKDGKYQVY